MELSEGFRDAIHVPFLVLKSPDNLTPGDKCSLRQDWEHEGTNRFVYCVRWDGGEPMWHGVADPFVEEVIVAGTLFRLMLRKECFSQLTHQFTIEVHDRGGTDTCHSVCDIW